MPKKMKPAKAVNPKKDMDCYPPNHPSIPVFDEDMSFFDRVRCVLQYHRWEERHALKDDGTPRMKLRDQCGRCGALR